MITITTQNLPKIRKELEAEFYVLLQSELEATGVRLREKGQLARKAIFNAEKISGNKSREALEKAFHQQVDRERRSLQKLVTENKTNVAKFQRDYEKLKHELLQEAQRLFRDLYNRMGISHEEQRELAKNFLNDALTVAPPQNLEALRITFFDQVQGVKSELERLFKKYEHHGFSQESDRRLAFNILKDGDALRKEKQYQDALIAYELALDMYTLIGHLRGMAAALMGMSWVSYDLGDYRSSEQQVKKSLRIWQDVDDQEYAGYAYSHLGNLAKMQGNVQDTREYWGKALTRFTNAGLRDGPDAQKLITLIRDL